MPKEIYIICGPTGSGKTAYSIKLAHHLAEKNGAVIINADSMQIYREIPVLTAQPSASEQAEVEHRLFGCVAMAEHSNVSKWLDMAVPEINEVLETERIPILVGGTGMYIKSLTEGINPVPDIASEIKDKVRNMDIADAYKMLEEKAPDSAAKIKPGDTQRIIRALEVVLDTGKSLEWWNAQEPKKFFDDGVKFKIKFINPDRAKLYDNINNRFLKMVENGVVDEVKALLPLKIDTANPSYKAHGLRELITYIEGEMSLEDAISKAQQITRNYAKRQVTWFSHQLKGAEVISG